MNFKRIGRALICLILVCVLLVNVSPIRADALVIESMLVNAGMVTLSCMLGLGVGFQTYEIAMPYIDDCVSYLKSIDYVNIAEQISIYSVGTQQYYASQEMVEAVRDWLFESGLVCVETPSTEGNYFYNGYEFPSIPTSIDLVSCPNVVIFYSSYHNSPFLIASNVALIYDQDNKKLWSGSNSISFSYFERKFVNGAWVSPYTAGIQGASGILSVESVYFTNYNLSGADNETLLPESCISEFAISVSDGLIAAKIAAQTAPLSDGYASWYGNSIAIPGQAEEDAPIIGLPLGLGPNLSDMIGLTQDDVWNGTSTYIPDEGTESTEPSIGVPSGSLGATDAAGFLGSLLDALMYVFEWFWGKIETFFGPWIDRIESWFSDVVSSIQAIPNALSGYFSDIIAAISSIPSTFRDWLLGIVDAIAGIPGAFAGWFADIIGGITSIPESIADVFGGVIDGVIALPGTIADVFADVIAGVIALPQTIADAITDAISALFVPSVGYIDAKVETLTSKFPFAKTIADSSLEMKKFLLNLGQQPPIIYIDLGAATGSYMWGGKTIFVDLTWYAQYKGTMDTVISAFLWLWFVWRMTLALPGIIQGTSGFWSKPDIPKENTSLTITGDSSHYFRR